ncbi:MAG: T9SS type A sorting domain-containing protein, partial [Marinilabiliaceae bacterium]|nr:T9SS type A sorting domain-containing protein [Marinilabiliaceae bacterium]
AKDELHFVETDKVLIYNLSGTLVASGTGGVLRMDISGLDKGIYLVKMERNSVIRTSKLVKK